MNAHRRAPGGRTAVLVLAAMLVAGCASRLVRPVDIILDAPEVVLPSLDRRGETFFLLSVRVNGEGPFAFYLDTGMATTLVSPEVSRHGSSGVHPLYSGLTLVDGAGNPVSVQGAVRLESVRVGGLELRDLDVLVLGMEGLSATLGRRVDGVLGYPCFAGGLLTIDFPGGEIRFGDGALGPVDGSTVFPLTEEGVPVLDLRMGDVTFPVLLDSGTGAGVVLGDLPSTVRFHAPPVAAGTLSGPAGRITGHRLGRIRGSIQFGPCLLEDPVVRLKLGSRGVIGTGVLESFRVVLDLAHGRFALEGGPPHIRFAPIHGTGADLLLEGDAFVVQEVIPASPAEVAGLREGDRVVSVDGVPAGRVAIAEFKARMQEPGATLRLQVQRGDRTFAVDLPVLTVVP